MAMDRAHSHPSVNLELTVIFQSFQGRAEISGNNPLQMRSFKYYKYLKVVNNIFLKHNKSAKAVLTLE